MSKGLPVLGSPGPGGESAGPASPSAQDAPTVPLAALDQLWFQVAGTVCNLRCSHCFISCSPENHSFWFLTREQVAKGLADSVPLGVKEYYFTGGEPFMNREMVGILEDSLALGPATVLTNATLLPQRAVDALARVSRASSYTLEFRVSIDGTTAAMNDALRGDGSFHRAMGGVERLVGAGFLPIITTMQTWDDAQTERILGEFRVLLAEVGYDRPRLKILPPLLLGAEVERTGGYAAYERVTHEMMADYDADLLLCARARLVTAEGVWVCPILLDSPSGRLGGNLREAVAAPAVLEDQACYTCYVSGAICANLPGYGQDFS